MSYLVHISEFDGPLDLLLHLIGKMEIDINDIFVSQITSQYLEYMKQLPELDLDMASEFIAMASTLLYIKSRSLLPSGKPEDEDQEDPEALLIRQLLEYKQFKEISERLSQLQEASKGMFTKLPDEFIFTPNEVQLEGVTLERLFEAISVVLKRERPTDETEEEFRRVHRDQYSVREKLAFLRSVLSSKPKVSFTELFESYSSNLEIIVTFMALLELNSLGELTIDQPYAFGDITFSRKEGLFNGEA